MIPEASDEEGESLQLSAEKVISVPMNIAFNVEKLLLYGHLYLTVTATFVDFPN